MHRKGSRGGRIPDFWVFPLAINELILAYAMILNWILSSDLKGAGSETLYIEIIMCEILVKCLDDVFQESWDRMMRRYEQAIKICNRNLLFYWTQNSCFLNSSGQMVFKRWRARSVWKIFSRLNLYYSTVLYCFDGMEILILLFISGLLLNINNHIPGKFVWNNWVCNIERLMHGVP